MMWLIFTQIAPPLAEPLWGHFSMSKEFAIPSWLRSECGAVVSMLALQLKGRGFDPPLFQSFG